MTTTLPLLEPLTCPCCRAEYDGCCELGIRDERPWCFTHEVPGEVAA